MTDIKLNSSHDLDFQNTEFSLTNDDNGESVAQRLRIKLWAFRGEWFWNTNFGVPYFQEIFVKGITKEEVDSIFKEQIKDTPGVISIIEFNSDFNRSTRRYELDFKVDTDTGVQEIEVSI